MSRELRAVVFVFLLVLTVVGVTTTACGRMDDLRPEELSMHKKWEYTASTVSQMLIGTEFREGNECERKVKGWELVCVSDGIFYFKREVLE